MKINISICNTIQEMLNVIVANNEYSFPLLRDSKTMRYIEILKKQGFEINYSDYISTVRDISLDDMQYSLVKENKDSVVVGLGYDEYKWIAYYHAKLNKANLKFCCDEESLLDWLEKQRYQYVTIIGKHEDIKISLISRVYKVQERVFNKFQFYPGFLTGRDINELLWLVLKNHLYAQKNIFNSITFDRLEYNDEAQFGEFNEVYPNASSTYDFVYNSIINKTYGLLTMIGHGRDDVYWLNDGAICGRSILNKESSKNVVKTNFPACYYTNSCFKRGTSIVMAKDIACRHVFMNSCYSNKVEQGLFPDEFNLVYAFIGGHSASYLGTSFMVDGQSTMNYYYVSQLMSGICQGVAAYNVSKFYLNYKLGHDMAFFLIGEPSNCLRDRVSTLFLDYDISDKEKQYDVNTEQYLITIRLPGSSLMDELINFRKKMKLFFSNNSNCFLVLRNDNDWTYLDIFSKVKMNPGKITIEIQDFPWVGLSVIRHFETILGIGIYPFSKFKTTMIEAKDMSLKIARERKYQAYNTKNVLNMYKKLERYKEKILYLSKAVIDFLIVQCHNKGFTWDDQCLGNGLNFSYYLKSDIEVCENCGRELYIMNYQHDFFDELKRDYYCCSACGIVKDFPSDYDDIEIYAIGEDKVFQTHQTQQTLIIKNKSKSFICGSVGMSIASGKEEDISYDSDMKSNSFEIYPGEIFEYTVKISISENTVPHNHWVYIYAIINGQIWSIKRDIWVVPCKDYMLKGE